MFIHICLPQCKTFIFSAMLYVLPNLSMEWGSSKEYGALIVTVTAACEFICRAGIFPLTGYFNINNYKFLNVCLLSCVSGGIALYFATPTVLLIHGMVHGFFALLFIPLTTLLMKVNYKTVIEPSNLAIISVPHGILSSTLKLL